MLLAVRTCFRIGPIASLQYSCMYVGVELADLVELKRDQLIPALLIGPTSRQIDGGLPTMTKRILQTSSNNQGCRLLLLIQSTIPLQSTLCKAGHASFRGSLARPQQESTVQTHFRTVQGCRDELAHTCVVGTCSCCLPEAQTIFHNNSQ